MKRLCWRLRTFFTFTVLAGLSAGAAELLSNSDFEKGVQDGKAVGWQYAGKKWSVGLGDGRNYSYGARYQGDGGDWEWLSQSVSVESGKLYRYEGWLKAENLTGKGGARLFVECYRENGRWCESTDGTPITGTTDGWVHLSFDLVPKKGAVKAVLAVRVDDGETGTVWVDELSFAPVARPPIKFLVSDAYRDAAVDGTVTFRLISNLADAEIAAKGWKGVFRFPDGTANAFFREIPAPPFSNGVSAVTVNVGDFPFGSFPVAFAFRDEKSRTVVSETMDFTRTRERTTRGVWIDRRGRTFVDGKPFFPLGMYMDGIDGERAERFAKGPFNCCLPYEMLTRAKLDWAQKNGLKVIYCLKNVYRGFSWQPFPMADAAEECAFVASRVAALKDHPALLAWYVADEMGVGMVPRMKERDRLIRRTDPDHPTFSCYCSPESMLEYMETSDVLGNDPYPLGSGQESALKRCAVETEIAWRAYFGTRPIWQVTQAFDSSWITKDKSRIHHPTCEEMLNMNLQCVAAGANGVILWEYGWLDRDANGRSEKLFEKNWQAACEAGKTLKKMIPLFLSEDANVSVEGRQPNMPVRVWRYEGRLCVLAVNATRKSRKATVRIGGHELDLEFKPLGYILRHLDE